MNLMDLFQFYLGMMFMLSIALRYRQYRSLIELVAAGPRRWPRLMELLRTERRLLLTPYTLVPVGLALTLMLVHSAMYNLLWPEAAVTPIDLAHHTMALGFLLVFGAAMVAVDARATFERWDFDAAVYEPTLDQAEFWLTTRWAPAIKTLTFGYVDPQSRVRDEVVRALASSQADVREMFINWSLQVGLRLGFGISLWLTWAAVLKAER
ncbi:MAG TPA: hypothetical protein PKD86_00040 [Gemmatales bacterium]|nr:hypothetical protein [Gemmatales bacterium]